MRISVASKEIIHFVGIGGIGMSGLAQIMRNLNFKIQGSDISSNKNTERLKSMGIKVFLGHRKENIKRATMTVISSAIKKNNPELIQSKKKNIPVYLRGEMLANVVSLKKNIVIAGSHGKTTTTSLVSSILLKAGLDPTVINGGVINSFNNSAKLGKSEWAVIESDESDGSFLKLPVTYSIVTNVDKEHTEYYKNYKNLLLSFKKFVNKTPTLGKAIVCIDDPGVKNIARSSSNENILTYGFSNSANYKIFNERYNEYSCKFNLRIKYKNQEPFLIKNIQINLIGEHNIKNAVAAIAVGMNLGLKEKTILKALKSFSGIQRRFTKIFSNGKNDFYDDYAHHPTEINSLLNGIKKVFPKRKIISVFQPHRYTRVKALIKSFSNSFKKSHIVILCPIYSAGEKKIQNINQDRLSKLISKFSNVQVINIKDEKDLFNYLRKNLYENELIVCLGAGSISNWIRNISKKL